MKELTDRLDMLRRRLVVEQALQCLVRYGAVVLALTLVLAVLQSVFGWEILSPRLLIGLVCLALGYPVIHALAHRPTREQTAVEFDERAGTGDRLITTWKLSQQATPASGGLTTAAIQEGTDRLRTQNFDHLLRWPHRRQWLTLAVVALMIPAALQIPAFLPGASAGKSGEDRAQQNANRQIARQLRDAAQAFAPLAETRQDNRALKELEDAARRLETAAPARAEELRKQALQELSSVEAAVRGALGATQQMALSPSEMSQLAAALQGISEFQRSGRELAAGRPDDAGRQLDDALTRLQQDATQDPQQSVRQVSRALAQSSIGPAAQETDAASSELMQQLMSENAAEASEALQQIARQLQMQGRKESSGQSRNSPSQGQSASQQLGKMLKELSDMKDQARGDSMMLANDDGNTSSDETEAGDTVAMVNSQGAESDQTLLMNSASGSFTLGSNEEQDFGTAEPLADSGVREIEENREGDQLRATPLLDDSGKTMQSLSLANGDFSHGSAEYRQLYEEARPFAEEAMEREDLPLGSRELVKRYFENIRPQ